jgi:hypothetical protein
MSNVAIDIYLICGIQFFIIFVLTCFIIGLHNHVMDVEAKVYIIATQFQSVVEDISKIDLRTDSTYTSILEARSKLDEALRIIKKK